MADCVVGTSVAVKWALAEPDSADAERVANDVIATGGTLHLLDIALVEAANAIWMYARRGKLPIADAVPTLQKLRQYPTTVLSTAPLLDDALDIALRFGVAVYDACFVAAVRHLGCAGVTADVPLVRKVGAAVPAVTLLKNW